MSARLRIGLVGARGYVGQELLRILKRHPSFEVAFELRTDADPAKVAAHRADAVVLALSNDKSPPYVAALDEAHRDTVIVDVSADHRVDDAWVYGLPEINRARIGGARRIANPGCYATAAALVIHPVAKLLAAEAHAFGVSGYSGAGATPSPRNDEEALRDNLMPYSLVGHLHEREVRRHAGPVFLLPHVAPFFRGITMTVSLPLAQPLTVAELRAVYERAYEGEPLVKVTGDIPLVSRARDDTNATIGGFAVNLEGRHAVVVSTLDNLLKGAASQAVQNLNLAFGFPETTAIEPCPF